MDVRRDRAPVWAIWLLIAFGAVQALLWSLSPDITHRPGVVILFLIVWITLLVLAALATRRIAWLWRTLTQHEQAHEATLNEVAQLQTQNAVLDTLARSLDVPLAFQELASRIDRLVPCDRVGLALLSDDSQEFQTYTARANGDESRPRGRPEVMFKVEGTIIGHVVRSREPFISGEMAESAADHLDANVVSTAGFHSALIVPLISGERAVGTLSVVSRRRNAFKPAHVVLLKPLAGMLATAWVAQTLQKTAGESRFQAP
ncbi:MAG TPA: GAF domain-containing protein [Vicinamibacterales bacterium]|nr:GAF domain-containing protein [Vicinamibacterales bacterium]